MALSFPGAGARAEPALTDGDLAMGGVEVRPADLAATSDGAESCAVLPDDMALVVRNDSLAGPVTGLARGDKIVRGVVTPVAVEVVTDEGAFDSSLSGHPSHRRRAPMADLRAVADVLEEDQSVLGHQSPSPREGVVGSIDHPPNGRVVFASVRVGAGLRAVPARQAGRPGVGSSASGTLLRCRHTVNLSYYRKVVNYG